MTVLYVKDKDNTISTGVSEPVEKIPTDEKDYRKCSFMCFTLYSHSIQRPDQHIANIEIVVYLLGCIQCSWKMTENILHKIYTEKGGITCMWLVLSTMEVSKEFICFHQMALFMLHFFNIEKYWKMNKKHNQNATL